MKICKPSAPSNPRLLDLQIDNIIKVASDV